MSELKKYSKSIRETLLSIDLQGLNHEDRHKLYDAMFAEHDFNPTKVRYCYRCGCNEFKIIGSELLCLECHTISKDKPTINNFEEQLNIALKALNTINDVKECRDEQGLAMAEYFNHTAQKALEEITALKDNLGG